LQSIHRDRGASALEYGLLVSALAAVVIAIVFALGTVSRHYFSQNCEDLGAGMSPTVDCSTDP
jgi:pilus assembly protein Flp/PilA